jgi:hypothetical protein
VATKLLSFASLCPVLSGPDAVNELLAATVERDKSVQPAVSSAAIITP